MQQARTRESQRQEPFWFEDDEEIKDDVGYEMDEAGMYHWVYKMDMMKERHLLHIILKLMVGIILGILVLIMLASIRGGSGINGVIWALNVVIPVLLVVVAIVYFSYWLTAKAFGGKDYMRYDMEDEGIGYNRPPETVAKIKALAKKNKGVLPETITVPEMTGGNNSMYSKFRDVRTVTVDRKNHFIGLKHLVMYNMIYVEEPYFEGVADYIVKRCVNAEINVKEPY